MSMNGAALAAALKPDIKTQLSNFFEIIPGFGEQELEKFASALSNAIGNRVVTYIQTNAVVNSTVVVASVSGVQPGSGASGPGTGTATGTIS